MPSSNELLDKVVDLINKAKVEAKEQKTYLLAQVLVLGCCRGESFLLQERVTAITSVLLFVVGIAFRLHPRSLNVLNCSCPPEIARTA